jgi:hypothetical protein
MDCSIRKYIAQEQEREQQQTTVQIPEHRLFTYIMAHGYAVHTQWFLCQKTLPKSTHAHICTDVKHLSNSIMVSEQVHCWRPASSLPHTTCILSEFGFLPSGMVYFAFFQQPVSNKFMCSLFCILYFGIGSHVDSIIWIMMSRQQHGQVYLNPYHVTTIYCNY